MQVKGGSPAPGDKRWLGGLSRGIAEREGGRQVGPTLCHPKPVIALLQKQPEERKGRAHVAQDPSPNHTQPQLLSLVGSQHAVGRALLLNHLVTRAT